MKMKELREKSKEELTILLREKQQELRGVRVKVLAEQHKQVRDVRKLRKAVAQIHTLLASYRTHSS